MEVLHPLRLRLVVLGRREVEQRTGAVAMDQEELDQCHESPPADRRGRVLITDREDAPTSAVHDAGEDHIGEPRIRVVKHSKLEEVGSCGVRPQLDADLPWPAIRMAMCRMPIGRPEEPDASAGTAVSGWLHVPRHRASIGRRVL